MNTCQLIIFEIIKNNSNELIKLISSLKKLNSYNIFIILTNKNINKKLINCVDYVFYSDNTNKLQKFIECNKFNFDYLIHILEGSNLNLKYIFKSLNNNLYVSSDRYHLCCRIIPKSYINLIDQNYYFDFNNNIILIDDNLLINYPKEYTKLNYLSNILNYNTEISNNSNLIKENDLISVIMTAYNSAKYIEISIRSILNQTYSNLELIIVDDGSTDETYNILKKYNDLDDRIKIIKLLENKGCYYAKNVGLFNIDITTKYITFQDSDDISYASRLQKQYKYMKDNKLLMSTCLFIENGILKMPMISKMIHKIVFDKIGFFGLNPFGEDECYYYRFFALFIPEYDWNNSIKYTTQKIGFFKNYKYYNNISDILYIVRRHSKSLTQLIKSPRKLYSQKLIKKYSSLVGKDINFIKNVVYKSFEIDNNLVENETNSINRMLVYNKLPININQVYVSKSLSHLKDRFLQIYNLKSYYHISKPCLFFGLYDKEDLNILKKHKGEKFIIWGGTDINPNYKHRLENINYVKKIKIKTHYAISKNIEDRMKELKIPCQRFKLNMVDTNIFIPSKKKGKSIFIYNGIKPGNESIYGKTYYKKVIKKLPNYKYIFSNKLNLPYDKMPQIYKKCFIGLRLTEFDGNANMVQEMNAMNIPVVHNGGESNCLKWNNINDIIKHIKNTENNNILIIFKKDLFQADGSLIWLLNFIKLIKINNSYKINVLCSKINPKIKLNNVIFTTDDKIKKRKFNKIYYRTMDDNIKFNDYSNVIIIIHYFDNKKINDYSKYNNILVHSTLIKDELIFNGLYIKKIKILPPLVDNINREKNKNNILTFCYCGTIKKSYKILEILILFNKLSSKYTFKFYLIYGKIKLEDKMYDKKLLILIDKLNNNKNFEIYKNIEDKKINILLSKSHYGLVIHSDKTDHKQQSTKLIKYLSNNCIPISYLSILNTNYINKNLHFITDIELKNLILRILKNEIKYDDIKINDIKLEEHLIKNNCHKILNDINVDINITTNLIKESNLVITNNYENKFYNKVCIYFKNEFKNRSQLIKNSLLGNIKSNDKFKIILYDNSRYNYIYHKLKKNFNVEIIDNIFDYKYDYSFLELFGPKLKNNYYFFSKDSDYIEFRRKLFKDFLYTIELDVDFASSGTLFILSIINFNNSLKDINRNLFYVQKNKSSIKFTINIKSDKDFIFKIKPSARKFKQFKVKFNKFKISYQSTVNKINDKVFVINMNKDIHKFKNIKNLLELNYIKSTRCEAINGYTNDIKIQFDEYNKKPYNEIEKKINRKLLVSPGAFGYLYSMKKIFEESIINNYEYIMICDDDIGLINDFTIKFGKLLREIKKPRILMLGSSQWEWNNIKYHDNFYIPNNYSNGSFCNIYHRSTFDNILGKIVFFNSPFDDIPMKSNFINKYCYVANPNLVIAQLEESSIQKKSKLRNYERFKWIKKGYDFNNKDLKSRCLFKNIKVRLNKILFIIGITTYNRINYLKECINSLKKSLQDKIDYILIFADGNSKDSTFDYIKSLSFESNISHVIISNGKNYIYRQSNSILKYSLNYNYDFGFLMNDDLLFLKEGWDLYYYKVYKKYNIDHLVYFDKEFKTIDHNIKKDKLLVSYCEAKNCQGALFTFTKKMIHDIGFFDEYNFKIRGHSHIDYTLRCCRIGYNNINTLFDVKDSNSYIKLNSKKYVSSVSKLPYYLREFHKVDIYEEKRRMNILLNDRKYIHYDFDIF